MKHLHHYVVCDDIVISMPTHEAATREATRLNSPGRAHNCGVTHIVIDADTPTQARDAYWRGKARSRRTLTLVGQP